MDNKIPIDDNSYFCDNCKQEYPLDEIDPYKLYPQLEKDGKTTFIQKICIESTDTKSNPLHLLIIDQSGSMECTYMNKISSEMKKNILQN